jgi:hypothetical protein
MKYIYQGMQDMYVAKAASYRWFIEQIHEYL